MSKGKDIEGCFDIAVFIDTIKKHPMIYDTNCQDYKNKKKKEELWQQLAIELRMGVSVESMKKKWKNLRDCHIKFLKNFKTGSVSNYYNKWPWARSMEFFRQYSMGSTPNAPTATHDAAELAPCRFGDNFELIIEDPLSTTTASKKRKLSHHEPAAATTSCQRPKQTWCTDCFASLDSTEHMFLAFAKTVKTFTPRRQTLTKMKISQLILECELEERNGETNRRASIDYAQQSVTVVRNEANDSSELSNVEAARSSSAEWLHEHDDFATKIEYN